jgi:leader peptidase (prepilin peptidase)/N-methyltransferase
MRLFWVELGTGVLFAFSYWHYGLGWELAMVVFYCCLFIALVVTDLEHGILPNKIVYPGMVVALVLAALGSMCGFEPRSVSDSGLGLWIVDAAIGGSIGFGLLLIVALISRGGMGGGDVKLAGLIGLVTGFPLVFVAMFLGVVSGGLVAGVLLVTKVKKRKETIPFGPFLCLAAMATLFWGNNLLAWYLGLS